MEKLRIKVILVTLLVATNIAWGVVYYTERVELVGIRQKVQADVVNVKAVNFTRLFINDVLRAQNEVDFETRLKLENAVRDLKDKEVLAQWGRFINSKTEAEAQEEVKNLLGLLVNKIEVK